MSSYQAGDRGEYSHSGHIDDVIVSVKKHVDDVRGILLTGSTNSNPMVTLFICDNSEEADQIFKETQENHPHVMRDIYVVDDIFLPDVFEYDIAVSGYCFNDEEYENKPHIDGYHPFYFPDAYDSIGIDEL